MTMSAQQLDALGELVNLGVGQAAETLNRMLETHVRLEAPQVQFLPLGDMKTVANSLGGGNFAAIRLPFRGVVGGFASLLFPPSDAVTIADLMVGNASDATDLDAMRIGALQEVGNIVLNAVMGTMASLLDEHLEYTIPTFVEDSLPRMLHLETGNHDAHFILARVTFLLETHRIEGNVILYLEVGSVDPLIHVLDRFIARRQ
jgi:chemotaxis protein CheC